MVIVSLTSFPKAINYATQAIRSILDGSVQPDKVVLYLAFRDFGPAGLPQELLDLAKENPIVEVHDMGTDIRSYGKLIPALKEFPDDVIVTIDDDIRYHRHMLRDLLKLHRIYPKAVLAHRAKRIRPELPYKKWRKYRWYHFLTGKIHGDFLTLQTGVAGVLYPPHCLKTDMLDVELFTKLAPTTDDIWLWAAAVANGTPVMPVPFGHNKPRSLGKPRELSLKTSNFKSGEDRNSAALHTILNEFPEVGKALAQR